MDIRPAETTDSDRISELARDSFQSSYALSPQQIDTLVEHEFDPETLGRRIDDQDVMLLVAEGTNEDVTQVQGFVDVETGAELTIRWLHVDPDARGTGVATALLEGVRETAPSTPLAARILDDAVEGGDFLEEFGLESDGDEDVTLGGEEFAVSTFSEGEGTSDENEPSVEVPDGVTVDGTDRPLDRDERLPGREAPFFPLYTGADRDERYGYFCSNCASTDVSGDGLDRLECGECGNLHVADEWDDSYL